MRTDGRHTPCNQNDVMVSGNLTERWQQTCRREPLVPTAKILGSQKEHNQKQIRGCVETAGPDWFSRTSIGMSLDD